MSGNTQYPHVPQTTPDRCKDRSLQQRGQVVIEGGKVLVVVAHGAPQDAGMRLGHKPCHRRVAQRRVLRLALRVHLPRVQGENNVASLA